MSRFCTKRLTSASVIGRQSLNASINTSMNMTEKNQGIHRKNISYLPQTCVTNNRMSSIDTARKPFIQHCVVQMALMRYWCWHLQVTCKCPDHFAPRGWLKNATSRIAGQRVRSEKLFHQNIFSIWWAHHGFVLECAADSRSACSSCTKERLYEFSRFKARIKLTLTLRIIWRNHKKRTNKQHAIENTNKHRLKKTPSASTLV